MESFSTHPFWQTLNKKISLNKDELLKSAKKWVICKYDFVEITKPSVEDMIPFMKSEPFLDYSKKIDLLTSYSAIISLMTLQKMEKSVFQSYLLNSPVIDRDFLNFLNSSALPILLPIFSDNETIFPKFVEFHTAAKPVLNKLEKFLNGKDKGKNKHKEKILYIAEILKNVFDLIDQKMILVSLVGILELLLTHNPLSNRFNVEDSITKQFKLKMGVIIHQNDKKCDLTEIKENLDIIYNLRSKIAHGDFAELNLLIAKELFILGKNKEYKKLNEKELKLVQDITLQQKDSILTKYNDILFKYVFYTLSTFLDDSEFVEFLKAG